MTDSEVEQVVLDVVRKYTSNESAGAGSRFEQDLRLSAAARGMLFASLAQAFAARGVSLPGHQFYLSNFLTCPTPAAVCDAIRAKVFGAATPKAAEGPAPATPPAPGPEPADRKAKAVAKKPVARKKQAGKKPPPKKPAAKKAAGAAKGRRGKR